MDIYRHIYINIYRKKNGMFFKKNETKKNVPFFYKKKRKRMERSECSFIKNGKECKDRNILL